MIPNYWSPGRGKLNIGNYYCQDFLNNPNCNFDGGDCCGANVNTDLCHECFCYDGCDTFFYPYWIDDGSEFGATIFFLVTATVLMSQILKVAYLIVVIVVDLMSMLIFVQNASVMMICLVLYRLN